MLTPVTVRRTERLSSSFVRVTLGHPDLADFGVDGPLLDQRIKLILPAPGGGFPSLSEGSWWSELAGLPDHQRCPVRTYTVAGVVGTGADTAIQVDLVLHPGAHGPGSAWAARAAVGDELMVVVPRRGEAFGGIEFDPGPAEDLLLVGDETALPAVAQILAGLTAPRRGVVFLEVPRGDDVRADLTIPDGITVTWLVRGHRPVGEALVERVSDHLGRRGLPQADSGPGPGSASDPGRAPGQDAAEIWETPTYSASGEELDRPGPAAGSRSTYAWIAGESGMVTALRRHLVTDLGLPRGSVAFMGYWRQGVAMRG